MKFYINIVTYIVLFSYLNAIEFTDEEIRMFLPFIKRWVPPPCPMNEIYHSCTGKCSDCTQRGRCIVTKCEEGCDCAPRFYRVTPDGPCEPVANCPKPECGENEVFRECGPICETCTFLECHVISCDHKCYCKEGYLRNKEGVCIPKDECPARTRCSRTEEWAERGRMDEFCVPGVDEYVNNNTREIPGCYCKEGHRRNLLGRCVNETLCPNIRCLGDEVYHECVPKCNTTCRNYGDPNCTEDENCYPGCFCPPGYVMNDFRSCIQIEKCSLDIEQVKFSDTIEDADDTDTTLPPTCAATDSTTVTDDLTSAEIDFNTEIDTKADEKISATTGEQIVNSSSPTSATYVNGSTMKEKSYKKDKEQTKHENLAKEKEIIKYQFEEDEDGFGNDDI